MRLHPNLKLLFRSRVCDLLVLAALIGATVWLLSFLDGPAGVAASWTTFSSSPVDTPTAPPSRTLPPSRTASAETSVPATSSPAPTSTSTHTPAPSDARPAPTLLSPALSATPVPTLAPLPIATPLATLSGIQMPLLPPTATSEPVSPTPEVTPTPRPLVSVNLVGGVLVAGLLVLAAIGGLILGGVLKNTVCEA